MRLGSVRFHAAPEMTGLQRYSRNALTGGTDKLPSSVAPGHNVNDL